MYKFFQKVAVPAAYAATYVVGGYAVGSWQEKTMQQKEDTFRQKGFETQRVWKTIAGAGAYQAVEVVGENIASPSPK